ncbi:neudesin-like [Glandiceps talaboti]
MAAFCRLLVHVLSLLLVFDVLVLADDSDGVKNAEFDGPEPDILQEPLRMFTDEDLAKYDGSIPELPIYMAVKGVVFDVTGSPEYYGKGAPYNALAGKDCTRAVAKMSLEPEDLSSDVTGLTDSQLNDLENVFKNTYKRKYKVVGHMAFSVVSDRLHTEL